MKEFSVVVQVNLDLQVKVKSSSLEEAVDAVEELLRDPEETEYEHASGEASTLESSLFRQAREHGEWMGGFVQEKSSGKPVAWQEV